MTELFIIKRSAGVDVEPFVIPFSSNRILAGNDEFICFQPHCNEEHKPVTFFPTYKDAQAKIESIVELGYYYSIEKYFIK